MLGTLIAAVVAVSAVKLFFAVCGHHITWRLAFGLVLLGGIAVMIYAGR